MRDTPTMHFINYRFIIIFIASLAFAGESGMVGVEEALAIPTIKQMRTTSSLRSIDFIKQAVANKHWQNAIKKINTSDRVYEIGEKKIPSFDVVGALDELVLSADSGVSLAAYQGYMITMQITMKKGPLARKYIPLFAAKMKSDGLCEGYYESAYAQAHGWTPNNQRDYKLAVKILDEGELACKNEYTPVWKHNYWESSRAQYNALLKEFERKNR